MSAMASQITGVTIVYSTVCSGADQRKHQSFASLAFVRGIHRSPVNSPHKGPVTRKMFLFDDGIMLFWFVPLGIYWQYPLWPSDAIGWQRSGSTLAQALAYYPTALSHYLNQWWLINNGFCGSYLRPIPRDVPKISLGKMNLKKNHL